MSDIPHRHRVAWHAESGALRWGEKIGEAWCGIVVLVRNHGEQVVSHGDIVATGPTLAALSDSWAAHRSNPGDCSGCAKYEAWLNEIWPERAKGGGK